MQKHITVLGSTGSIGTQTLDIARYHGYTVDALALGKNIRVAEEQIRAFHPKYVAVSDAESAAVLKDQIRDTDTKIFAGDLSVCEMLDEVSSDVCIQAMSGFAGLRPTLKAMERFPRIGLANKETIVAAGKLVMQRAKEMSCEIIPVDSEHSAIFQCLGGARRNSIRRILLTCSGGPFFGMTQDELRHVTARQTLSHPTWKMGAKITVDCATLMNKGLEIIEAMHLFDVSPEQIEVVIHRESIIHSMVEYSDKAIVAQLGVSDMRIPIQYAITYPSRMDSQSEALDFAKLQKLSFYEPDRAAFPLLALAEASARKGGIIPCVMNAANEEAVSLFLSDKIGFSDIFGIVDAVTSSFDNILSPTLDDTEKANQAARAKVHERFAG